jgi:hypothetical protein
VQEVLSHQTRQQARDFFHAQGSIREEIIQVSEEDDEAEG